VIVTVVLFGGAIICVIALLTYALLQQNDILRQLEDIKKEQAYASRIIQQYDRREVAKQHVKLPPVEVKKPRSVPAPDLTIWGGESLDARR
jgi:hypothetical protein